MRVLIIDRHAVLEEKNSRYQQMAAIWKSHGIETDILTNSFSPLTDRTIAVEKGMQIIQGDSVRFIIMKNKPYSTQGKSWPMYLQKEWMRINWMVRATGFFKKYDAIIVSATMPSDISALDKYAKKKKKTLLYDMESIWPMAAVEKYGRSTGGKWMKRWVRGEHDAYCFTQMILSRLPYIDKHLLAKSYHPHEGKYYMYLPDGISMDQVENWNRPNMDVVKFFIEKREAGKMTFAAVVHEDTKDEIIPLMNEMAARRDSMALAVLCSEEEKTAYEEKSVELGIDGNVFVGEKGDEETWVSTLKIADAVYYTAAYDKMDRFGYVKRPLLLTMAAGRPVLYRVQASNDPIKESVGGRSTASMSGEDLGEALGFFLKATPQALDFMGENSKRYIAKNHEIVQQAEKYREILERPYKNATYAYNSIMGGKKVTVGDK